MAELQAAGVADAHLEPVDVNRWTPESCTVTWWRDDAPQDAAEIACFALPYSQPEVELTAPLLADTGTEDLTGAVGVLRNRFPAIPQELFADESLEVRLDDATLADDEQPIPFGVRNGALFGDFFQSTIDRGGAGMLGVIEGLGTHEYYAPYTGVDVDLPAAWIGEQDGTALLAAMADGPVTATIRSSATREVVPSSNVVGSLPGPGDGAIVIGSHHDAPWASAVEDATGIAQVLAQAQHWAAVPESERPHPITFLLSTGHMAGAAGSLAFVDEHAELMDRTVLELHLEHVALRPATVDGEMVATEVPEVRWWFTTDRDDLRAMVLDALDAEGMRRDLVLPDVGFFGAEGPLSDAAPFTWGEVPIISMISAPAYLFDARDTIDKVDVDGMATVHAAAVRLVEGSAELTQTRTTP